MLLSSLWPPVALLLAGAPGAVGDAAEAIDPPANEDIIKATQGRDQRLTVPVSIAGHGPFDFLVDTGAQATVVTGGVVDRLGPLERGRAMLVGMASRRVVDTVEVDGLVLGSRIFDNLTSPVLDARHVGADGIIGLDSLQDQRVLLDFKTNTLTVSDAKSLGGNRGFEIIVKARRKLGQLVITDAVIDGIRTAVIVDTGSQATVGNLSLQSRLRQRRGPDSVMTDVTGATMTGRISTTELISMGNVHMRGVSITFADAPPFASLGFSKKPALILGMRDLRLFDRVAIDFASRQILFDLPRGARTVRQGFLD
ncbi:retroviral-like aspartic protease family protein [Altererythrobacter aquiaggeris]|uniref:retroviral-like aspartic protease family protein n=1 Tax=Aestuarierythrobacter aquiaggeris TaxID=1898396 RepID=UPI0030171D1F